MPALAVGATLDEQYPSSGFGLLLVSDGTMTHMGVAALLLSAAF